MPPDAFYLPRGEGVFRSSVHTTGPWDPGSQHGGPPSALLARALTRCPGRLAGSPLVRLTVELLGPVPVAEVTVAAQVERPGRRVELVAAQLCAGGRTVALARGWRVAGEDTAAVATAPLGAPPPLPPPGPLDGLSAAWQAPYLEAMEWRFVRGGFSCPGPATVWSRQLVALVEGEEPTGVERLLCAADSGNGVSSVLDIGDWIFVNTELTVHIGRAPMGEWVCLQAETSVGPAGTGLASSRLWDRDGEVGRGAQALFVGRR